MTSRDFVYWLQGHFELTGSNELSVDQVKVIRAHLALVFIHEIDPSAGPPEHQAKLNAAHDAPKPYSFEGQTGGATASGVLFRC